VDGYTVFERGNMLHPQNTVRSICSTYTTYLLPSFV